MKIYKMHKTIVFSFVLFSFPHFLYGMDNEQSQNIIPRAAYYVVWRSRNKTTFKATFFKNRNKHPQQETEILTKSYKEWNTKQQSELDAMIDPEENLSITHAKIRWYSIGTTCGRNIIFLNNKNEPVAIKLYDGPIDIKKDPLRIDLIKPHSLLNKIKKVEEWDDALPLQGIIGFFEPSYSYPYCKKYIEYNDNKTPQEIVTRQHRFIQGIYLSIIYGILYYLIKSFSK